MCCLITTIGVVGPRAGILVWYLLQPLRWQAAFPHTALAPLLGALFLPWTTLTWVAVAPDGFIGFDWFLIGFALLVDIAAWSGGLFGNRRRAPGYPY
ncbi:MAG: hypothetical protein J2P45_17915 [Candidatus Dormibacteraeota bacterium]|nr:hypothetical protein [Candidatus Dormibacteraeota bacterium]